MKLKFFKKKNRIIRTKNGTSILSRKNSLAKLVSEKIWCIWGSESTVQLTPITEESSEVRTEIVGTRSKSVFMPH